MSEALLSPLVSAGGKGDGGGSGGKGRAQLKVSGAQEEIRLPED
jgi:hypothetical protein